MSKAYKARRTALYVPASNSRALEKARTLDADVVILDLEDAVAAEDKVRARATAAAILKDFAPREAVVRVNSAPTPWHDEDMAAMAEAMPAAILLAKISGPEDIAAARAKCGEVSLWAMIETPRAVFNALAIADAGVDCLMFGVNDLVSAMFGRHRPDRANIHAAMSQTVLAARAADITALDGVHNALDDMTGFAKSCAEARDFGFDGKSVIHPSQIGPAKTAFSPSLDEIAYARRVLAAFAAQPGASVVTLDRRMLEALDAASARRTLARAGL
ncbi:MAG: CoA ester lyase [Alphaproteobacteria bacterium]|nr:CoA ester lyase [Alphaproteobacteria bacterium]